MAKNYSIYFICEEGTNFTKIGYSNDIPKRLEAVQTGNPRELWIAATIGGLTRQSAISLENYLHKRLSGHNIRSEWFRSGIFLENWFSEKFTYPEDMIINLIDLPIP